MATLFEGMLNGSVPSLPVLTSEKLQVGAILANPQETIGQLVVFPFRPARALEDLTDTEDRLLNFAVRGLAKHLRNVLGVDRVVRHAEGYGVPNHAHWVVLPSYQRGDSDRIHHPSDRLPWEEFAERYSATQQMLEVTEEYLFAEAAAQRSFMIEEAT